MITNSSLSTLGLVSLKSVKQGVIIKHNTQLCVNHSVAFWQDLLPKSGGVLSIADNKPEEKCGPCDSECDDQGCWGPEPSECRRCRYLIEFDDTCVTSCDKETRYEEN